MFIPAYNEEKGIGKTIDSCLEQTQKPDKIIVVNDGSTDNALNKYKNYILLLDRINEHFFKKDNFK